MTRSHKCTHDAHSLCKTDNCTCRCHRSAAQLTEIEIAETRARTELIARFIPAFCLGGLFFTTVYAVADYLLYH